MNELLSYCSPELLEKLAGEVSDNVRVLAAVRIEREIDKLAPVASRVLRWKFGVGCSAMTRTGIARRLNVSVTQVAAIESDALVELGFRLIGHGGTAAREVAA